MKILVCCLCVLVSAVVYSQNDNEWEFLARKDAQAEDPENMKRAVVRKCKQVADIGLVIDSSVSIRSEHFKEGRDFIAKFASEFKIGPNDVRFSAITFSDGIHKEDAIHFNQHTNKKSLVAALKRIPHRQGGYTATGDGIAFMRDTLMQEARRKVAHFGIVITDGASQDWRKTAAEATEAKQRGMLMIAIGVGEAKQSELERIASRKKFVLRAESYRELNKLINPLLGITCEVLEKPDEGHCFQVADFALVIDSSRSLRGTDFKEGQQFVANFANLFKIGPNNVRFSAITFSNGTHEEDAIQFNRYTKKRALIKAILRLRHREGGYTSTGDGIEYMREVLMKQARNDVRHFGIVITDGNSQEWQRTANEARKARADDIIMIAIGVGDVKKEELDRIATGPRFIFHKEKYDELQSLMAPLVQMTCEATWPPNPCTS